MREDCGPTRTTCSSSLITSLLTCFPLRRDLLYHFLDAAALMTASELSTLSASAGIDPGTVRAGYRFLIYYGVLGRAPTRAICSYIAQITTPK